MIRAIPLFLALAGCASVIGLDDLHRDGARSDAGAGAAGASIGSSSIEGGVVGDPSCSGHAGPPSVRVSTASGSFCIDATEVTIDDYAAFVATGSAAADSLPDGCDGHDVHPGGAGPGVRRPATSVDWCDAAAYCAWAGKTLCGKIGGGSLDPLSAATAGAWYSACVDGAPGLSDMSGSVAEWEDLCTDGGDGSCSVRGGASDGSASTGPIACSGRAMMARTSLAPDVGFRCCGS